MSLDSCSLDELQTALESIQRANDNVLIENEVLADFVKRNNVLSELADLDSSSGNVLGSRNFQKRLQVSSLFIMLSLVGALCNK